MANPKKSKQVENPLFNSYKKEYKNRYNSALEQVRKNVSEDIVQKYNFQPLTESSSNHEHPSIGKLFALCTLGKISLNYIFGHNVPSSIEGLPEPLTPENSLPHNFYKLKEYEMAMNRVDAFIEETNPTNEDIDNMGFSHNYFSYRKIRNKSENLKERSGISTRLLWALFFKYGLAPDYFLFGIGAKTLSLKSDIKHKLQIEAEAKRNTIGSQLAIHINEVSNINSLQSEEQIENKQKPVKVPSDYFLTKLSDVLKPFFENADECIVNNIRTQTFDIKLLNALKTNEIKEVINVVPNLTHDVKNDNTNDVKTGYVPIIMSYDFINYCEGKIKLEASSDYMIFEYIGINPNIPFKNGNLLFCEQNTEHDFTEHNIRLLVTKFDGIIIGKIEQDSKDFIRINGMRYPVIQVKEVWNVISNITTIND